MEQPNASLPEKAVEYAARDGFAGVEYLPCGELETDTAMEYAKRLREKLDAYGLSCPCYSVPITILENPRQASILLRKTVDVAHALGSPYLHHTFHLEFDKNRLPDYRQAEPLFVEVAREVAEYAGERGIACLYEEQGYLMNTPERLRELLDKVAMPNTGICLDAGNALFADIPAEVYARAFAAEVRHVHIKDYRRSAVPFEENGFVTLGGSYLQDVPLGQGIVDTEQLLTPLMQAGYDGWFSLEESVTPIPQAGIQQSMKEFEYIYNRVYKPAYLG